MSQVAPFVGRKWHGILLVVASISLGCAHLPERELSSHSTEGFELHTLENGLRIVTVEDHNHPIIGVAAFVTTGGRTETSDYTGALHFIEHLIFKGGTKRFPPTTFRKTIAALGRENGGWTWDDEIQFGFEVPRENFSEALDVLTDSLMELQWTRRWFENERKVVLQEIEKVSERPWHQLWNMWDKAAFKRHPYGRSVIGSKAIIEQLSFVDLERYYQQRFRPNHMLLAIVGDFDTTRLINTIDHRFRTYESGQVSFELPDVQEPIQKKVRRRHETNPALSNTRMLLGFRTPGARHQDTAALLLLAEMLSTKSSGLWARPPNDTKWALQIDVAHSFMVDHGTFIVTVGCPNEHAATALTWLRKYLTTTLPNSPISPSAIQESIRRYESKQALTMESYGKHAIGLGFMVERMGPERTRLLRTQMSVLTPEALQAIAQKYFQPSKLVEAVLGPADPLAQPAQTVTLPDADTEPVTLEIPGLLLPSDQPPWPIADQHVHHEVVRYRFANGMRLIVHSIPNAPVLSVVTLVQGGQVLEPANQAGVSVLTSRLLASGTTNLTKDQWDRVLESRAITTHHELRLGDRSNVARNVHYRDGGHFALQGTPDQWTTLLSLAGEALYRPRFSTKEVQRQRQLLLSEIDGLVENNLEFIKQEFYGLAYPDHPYGRPTIGTRQTVETLEIQAIERFHRRAYVPANTIVTVVGTVDPDTVAHFVATHWTEPDPSTDSTQTIVVQQPSLRPEALRGQILRNNRTQRCVNLGLPTLPPSDPQFTALEVLFGVVHGHHFYKYVYELGVSYRSWMRLWPNRWSSTWIVENDVKTTDFDKTLQDMETDIRWYATGPFGKEQIDLAKSRLINETLLERQDSLQFAFELTRFEGDERGFEAYLNRPTDLKKVHTDVINDLAKKTFEKGPAYQLILQ
jgi:zinc protease